MPRSGSDQHLPRVDYTSITTPARHTLLRSSLKSGLSFSTVISIYTLGVEKMEMKFVKLAKYLLSENRINNLEPG